MSGAYSGEELFEDGLLAVAAIAQMLLTAGAAVDAKDRYGKTPLSIAIFNLREGDGAVIRRLLAGGARPGCRE